MYRTHPHLHVSFRAKEGKESVAKGVGEGEDFLDVTWEDALLPSKETTPVVDDVASESECEPLLCATIFRALPTAQV